MQSGSDCPDAIAYIKGGPGAPCLSGEVRFYQERGCVLVTANIAGLPQESGSGFLHFIFMRVGIVQERAFLTLEGIIPLPMLRIPIMQETSPL